METVERWRPHTAHVCTCYLCVCTYHNARIVIIVIITFTHSRIINIIIVNVFIFTDFYFIRKRDSFDDWLFCAHLHANVNYAQIVNSARNDTMNHVMCYKVGYTIFRATSAWLCRRNTKIRVTRILNQKM